MPTITITSPGLLWQFIELAFNAESVFPIDANHIRLQRWSRSHAEKAAQHGIDSANIQPDPEQVIDQDIKICERVQTNLACGACPGGLLSPQREAGTIYFRQPVRAALAGFTEAEESGAQA